MFLVDIQVKVIPSAHAERFSVGAVQGLLSFKLRIR